MLILAGNMEGTMASMTTLVNLGSGTIVCPSERSRSLNRRISLIKRSFRGCRRWHCLSISVCKYSVSTDFVTEQDNSMSLDSNSLIKEVKIFCSQANIVLNPAPKPTLKPESKAESILDINSVASRVSEDSDDKNLGGEEKRNKVIELLEEVLDEAENLEASKSGQSGTQNNNGSVNRLAVSSKSNSLRNSEPLDSVATPKTMKSIWRKGDTVATKKKVVKESPKPTNQTNRDEPQSGVSLIAESQTSASLRPPQLPLRPQPKLQGKNLSS